MFVMAKEPIPNMSAAEVKAYFAEKHTVQDLADAYAIAHNKFWWVEDNEYDFEEGTPEHKAACAIPDEWGASHHVIDQCTIQAVKCTMLLVITVTFNEKDVSVNSHCD